MESARFREILRGAMSQLENVRIVRDIYEAWGAGDFSAGLDELDPHVTFVVRPPFPEPAVLNGPDAIREYLVGFMKQFASRSHSLEALDLREVGDTVIAHVNQHATGRASGVEGDLRFFMLFTFRGRKIVRLESVLNEAEALEAAGLSE
jgi:ketosteroid isomerase-like protein